MTETLRCMRRTAVYDVSGRLEKNRRIDAGDICLIGEKNDKGLYAVVYPIRKGTRKAYIRDKSNFAAGFRLYNQNDYGHVAYPARGYENATVKSGGCGVTAMAMAVENLVLGMMDPAEAASLALRCGARVPGGTDMRLLGKAVCAQYPVVMQAGSSVEMARDCMARGGVVIVNTGGDRGKYRGVFSSGGHYVLLLRLSGAQAVVADPGYYAGKYRKSWRTAVTVDENGLLHCDLDLLAQDSCNRHPAFYCFERKVGA